MQFKNGRNIMFAVGHVALGYLTGKAAAKLLNARINIPLVFLASIIPDADFLLGLEHRGPTHSLIVQTIVFIPVFLVYRKQAAPVFVSLIQHPLLGDLIAGAGGVQLFWPISSQWYGTQIGVTSVLGIALEWAVFIIFIVVLLATKDIRSLLQPHRYNLLLTIPVLAVILPSFLQYPLSVPDALIIPHLILLAILVLSIAANLRQIVKSRR
jgi:membrane-bound metal-dependent hydrolase YbcI (DUF457 family)